MIEQAQTALAARAAVVEKRLARQTWERSLRRQSLRSYPGVLAPVTMDEMQDIAAALMHYARSPLLSDRQRALISALFQRTRRVMRALSRFEALPPGRRGAAPESLTPSEWEQFWSIRDFLYPPEPTDE